MRTKILLKLSISKGVLKINFFQYCLMKKKKDDQREKEKVMIPNRKTEKKVVHCLIIEEMTYRQKDRKKERQKD
jgi:hypothetical protein